MRSRLVAALALATLLAATAVFTSDADRKGDQGAVHFLAFANSSFDRFTLRRARSYGDFLRMHISRMVVFSPYFDDKTRWYPNGWVYDDAYAIYRGSGVAARHPQWILHDSQGNRLYIPYACANGACPQYAGDISNPAFRRYWIAHARAELRRGYRGLFIDDVNMEFRVGDGRGRQVAPIDSATRQPMSYSAWRVYMAQFMAEVRTALPRAEIAHNVIWFADTPSRTADPSIRRELAAADYLNLERGVNDPGLTGGSGADSLHSFLAYIDAVHALGKGIVLDGGGSTRRETEYSLASYLLMSAGRDLISADGMTPVHWWTGLDVNLGNALGPRRPFGGVLRRDFSGGRVLVNEPDAATRVVALPAAMRDLEGHIVTSVTLTPASGAVLQKP